jgi:hypothetical protein
MMKNQHPYKKSVPEDTDLKYELVNSVKIDTDDDFVSYTEQKTESESDFSSKILNTDEMFPDFYIFGLFGYKCCQEDETSMTLEKVESVVGGGKTVANTTPKTKNNITPNKTGGWFSVLGLLGFTIFSVLSMFFPKQMLSFGIRFREKMRLLQL